MVEKERWVRCRGNRPDQLVGQVPHHGEWIIFTTAEVENKVEKHFPMCPDIADGDEHGNITILEIYTKEEVDVLPGVEPKPKPKRRPAKKAKPKTRGTSGKKAK